MLYEEGAPPVTRQGTLGISKAHTIILTFTSHGTKFAFIFHRGAVSFRLPQVIVSPLH